MTRSTELNAKFEALSNDAADTIAGCDAGEWAAITAAEGWTVAATAHHVAIVQRAFTGMVERLAAGETYTPNFSMDDIHRENARHAEEYAAADRGETLAILESSSDDMLAALRSIDDDALDRVAGTFGGNELTVGQVIEYVVIGHLREHLGSIQATLAR